MKINDLLLKGASIAAPLKQNKDLIDHKKSLIADYKSLVKELEKDIKELECRTAEAEQLIIDTIVAHGSKAVDFNGLRFTAKKKPDKVKVVDEFMVPDQYVTEKLTYQIDKRHIMEDYKKLGILADGVEIESGEYTLLIKEKPEYKMKHSNDVVEFDDGTDDEEIF